MPNLIKKSFEIESIPLVMRRFERFLAMLHYNSAWGHSAMFAMPLDGDGAERFKVSPKPGFRYEVNLVGGIGGTVEIAYDDCYASKHLANLKSDWVVCPSASLYKNGDLYKTIPSDKK